MIPFISLVVAYFAAVPLETFKQSGQLIAAVFFESVFGEYAGRRVLPVFVALSAVCIGLRLINPRPLIYRIAWKYSVSYDWRNQDHPVLYISVSLESC